MGDTCWIVLAWTVIYNIFLNVCKEYSMTHLSVQTVDMLIESGPGSLIMYAKYCCVCGMELVKLYVETERLSKDVV